MSQQLDLGEVEKRARRTLSQDGLVYIILSLLLAMIGLSLADNGFSGLAMLGLFLALPLELLRRRITYPRVGYAKLSEPPGATRGILGFALAAVIVLTVIAFAGGGRFQRVLPAIVGLLFAMAFYFGASIEGIGLVEALLIPLIAAGGVIVSIFIDDWHLAVATLLWGIAALLLIIGLVRLILFVRSHPPVTGPDAGSFETPGEASMEAE